MQKVLGVTAEYNPMHLGHAFHLAASREQLGEDCPVVCVMSGDFVQRGTAAVYDKFTRAEAAVRAGADLVLELPLPWSIASAEGFARGAVRILAATGVVTHLSFGSECGEAAPLQTLADALLAPDMDDAIRTALRTGVSYPKTRQLALRQQIGELADLLETPNNILGIEYLKAVSDLGLSLTPITVRRTGAQHDQAGEGQLRSAPELRALLEAGADISRYVPAPAAEVYAHAQPVLPRDLETALLSRLRMLPPEAFRAIPGAEEGLENALCRAVHAEPTLEAVLMAAKSKRYALSRLRRMALCAALGVTKERSAGLPPYLRVLAANARGRALLRQMAEASALPVITKPAAVKELSADVQRVFEVTAAAHDLYVLGYAEAERRRPGEDWRHSPAML